MQARFARPLVAGLVGVSPLAFNLRRLQREDTERRHFRCISCEEVATNCERFVEAKFHGMHKKGLVDVGDWHEVTLCPPITARKAFTTMRYLLNVLRQPVDVKVWDAREKEEREGLSKAEFFKRHGFVLLNRRTDMSAQDWNASAPKALSIANLTGEGMPSAETPLSRIYAKEVEGIVRELLPDSTRMELDPLVVRRGPGTAMPGYNFAPHQDYGFTDKDWPLAGPEFHERFASAEVKGLVVINCWRPVLPMRGPVQKTPLAVCDPATVKIEDVIPINVKRDELGYTKMLDLAHDADQQWYHYPNMTVDEVLVFKSFQYFKSQTGAEINTCFHTAFEHPTPPRGAEERQSCEYRVRIWF